MDESLPLHIMEGSFELPIATIDELLTSWSFEDLIPTFKDQQIDLEVLSQLEVTDLLTLIPKMGPRKIFMKQLGLWKESLKNLEEPELTEEDLIRMALEANIPKTTQDSAVLQKAVDQTFETQREPSSPSIDKPTTSIDKPTTSIEKTEQLANASIIRARDELATATVFKCNQDISNSVSKYLTNDVNGLSLQAKYDARTYGNKERQMLSKIVVIGELAGDPKKRIAPERFVQLATETCEIFVGEDPLLYYIPRRVVRGISVAPKGKFYNTYTNITKDLRGSGLRLSRQRADEPEPIEEVTDTIQADLTWLSTRTQDWPTVLQKWSATSTVRLFQLRNSVEKNQKKKKGTEDAEPDGIQVYISTYLALQQPNGYTLLELDFAHLYPDRDLKLATQWDRFAKTVCTLSGLDYAADLAQAVIFHAFANLFTPATLKGKVGRKKRSTKIEIVEGFLLHIKVIDYLHPIIARMREKARTLKQTIQPLPVSIGPTADSITESYVVIEEVLYKVESPLRAIDVTFKSYHALHAQYPAQSEAPWLLLQQAVYDIHTKWDSDIPQVIDLKKHFTA